MHSSKDIQIITAIDSNRLRYVCDFIFKQLGQSSYKLCEVPSEDEEVPVLIYENRPSHPAVHTLNSGLLNHDSPIPEDAFLSVNPLDDDLSTFDAFALIFFLLSRYEEYDGEVDEFGRFNSQNSWLRKNNMHRIPLVDRLVQRIFSELNARGYPIKIDANYSSLLTCDIDQLYAFKGKGRAFNFFSFFKDAVTWNWKRAGLRLAFLLGSKDAYDEHIYLTEQAESRGLSYKAFILVGKTSKWDKNHSSDHPLFLDVIRQWGRENMGIHPSFNSHTNVRIIASEKDVLSQLVQRDVGSARMHFLRLQLPETFDALLQSGIVEDFSLGYHDEVGFRSGTAHRHLWYNLNKEESTDLWIRPLVAMDVSLKNALDLSAQEGLKVVQSLIGETKKSQGDFILLWHNSSFSSDGGWKGWRSVFENIMDEMK